MRHLIAIAMICAAVVSSSVSAGRLDISKKKQLDKFLDLSFEELFNIKVDVASNRAKPVREQPGIISVITEDEIKRSGARNLQELLKFVPGFGSGSEILSSFGPTFRGIWALEGKVLLIVDGIPQNDVLFGNIQLGNHYSTDTMKQVEIIRGPGSVIYGGNAELAVIKVTTKGAELDGSEAAVTADFTNGNFHTNNYTFSTGRKIGEGSYSFSGQYSAGDFANDSYTSLIGDSFRLNDNSNRETINLNFGSSYKNFKYRFMYDRYYVEDLIVVGFVGAVFDPTLTPYTDPIKVLYTTFSNQASYDWQVNDKLQIIPKFTWTLQKPFESHTTSGPFAGNANSTRLNRWETDIKALYDISDNTNILVGSTYTFDRREAQRSVFGTDLSTAYFGRNYAEFDDLAGYFQLESDSDWANITVGGRYEHHKYAGSQFVPRVAVTKVIDKWHGKLMYNEAFRIPTSGVIGDGNTVGPETTRDVEGEVGYQLSESVYLQGNLFWLEVDDYIAYDSFLDTNINAGKISTWGAEFLSRVIFVSREKELGLCRC